MCVCVCLSVDDSAFWGLLLCLTQSLIVSENHRGAKGWLGTCWELSFILLVAPELGCGCTVRSGGEKKQVVLGFTAWQKVFTWEGGATQMSQGSLSMVGI